MKNVMFLREKLRENPAVLFDNEIANLAGIKIPAEEKIGKFLDMTHEELVAAGFSDKEADIVRSIKELATRYLSERLKSADVLASPQRVVDFLRAKIGGLPHEAFAVIFLNAQNEVLGHEVINEGTVDQVAVYPRRIIVRALAMHAAALIIAHNHPSGHVEPSEEDKNLTRTVKSAASVLDIRVLDHVIVGKNGYFSFIERGLL